MLEVVFGVRGPGDAFPVGLVLLLFLPLLLLRTSLVDRVVQQRDVEQVLRDLGQS